MPSLYQKVTDIVAANASDFDRRNHSQQIDAIFTSIPFIGKTANTEADLIKAIRSGYPKADAPKIAKLIIAQGTIAVGNRSVAQPL